MGASVLNPDMLITGVPFAMNAGNSESVGGFGSGSLLRAVDGGGNPTAVGALNPTNMGKLTDLINGVSTQYVRSNGTAGATLPTTAPASPANGSIWWESGTIKYYDGISTQTVGTGAGGVTSVGLSMPGEFSIANPLVTTTGTFTASWASQPANEIFAAPDAASGG